MRGKNSKWVWLSVLLVFTLALSACGIKKEPASTTASGATEDKPQTEAVTGPLSGKRIALIMEFNTGTFSQQYVQGVKEEIEKFGGQLTTFVADNDKAKMVSLLDSAINQKFDAILTDHGDSLLTPGVKKAVEQNIPVVVFDADINVPGATVLSQDDQKMAELTLEQMKKILTDKAIS